MGLVVKDCEKVVDFNLASGFRMSPSNQFYRNVSRQAVSKWESNQTLPDLDKVVLMSEFFGVSTDYILTGKDKSAEYVLSTDKQMNKNWSTKKLGILVSLVSLI